MPLVKVFRRAGPHPNGFPTAASVHQAMTKIWDVPESVCKILIQELPDWSCTEGESVYIDIRAKAKNDRTGPALEIKMQQIETFFRINGHIANIRVELYDPTLQHSRVPKP